MKAVRVLERDDISNNMRSDSTMYCTHCPTLIRTQYVSLITCSWSRNRKAFDNKYLDIETTILLFRDHLKLWVSRAPRSQSQEPVLDLCSNLVGVII